MYDNEMNRRQKIVEKYGTRNQYIEKANKAKLVSMIV